MILSKYWCWAGINESYLIPEYLMVSVSNTYFFKKVYAFWKKISFFVLLKLDRSGGVFLVYDAPVVDPSVSKVDAKYV